MASFPIFTVTAVASTSAASSWTTASLHPCSHYTGFQSLVCAKFFVASELLHVPFPLPVPRALSKLLFALRSHALAFPEHLVCLVIPSTKIPCFFIRCSLFNILTFWLVYCVTPTRFESHQGRDHVKLPPIPRTCFTISMYSVFSESANEWLREYTNLCQLR